MDLTLNQGEECWETLLKKENIMSRRQLPNLATEESLAYAGGYCGCWVFLLILSSVVGGIAFDYDLWAILGANVPWYIDALCGLIIGPITITIAIILFVLSYFIPFPIWHIATITP